MDKNTKFNVNVSVKNMSVVIIVTYMSWKAITQNLHDTKKSTTNCFRSYHTPYIVQCHVVWWNWTLSNIYKINPVKVNPNEYTQYVINYVFWAENKNEETEHPG